MGCNGKLKRLKPFLQLIVFSLLTSTVCADNSTFNSTDYSDEEEMGTYLLVEPAPVVIPQCGLNEVYQNCEVSCINCEDRGMCEPQNCHLQHCDCRIFFVHVTPGGPCEHVSVCPPKKCPENEVYRHCGPYCEYCDLARCRSMECSSRCYCKEGYLRDRESGKCIPEKECPERLNCISNDEVAKSGPASEYCLETESEAQRGNETVEEEKCYCASGFKRNAHGWCIDAELCHFVTCAEDTIFQGCPKKCNTTCWNYGDPNCEEDGQCYPSCFCKDGFVMNEFFTCIPLDQCPPGSNPFVPTLPPPTVGPIPEPSLDETGEASAAAAAESSSGSGSSSAVAESSSKSGSSSAAAASSSGSGGSSEAAAASSSDTGDSSAAAAAESNPGKGSSSASAAESASGKESSSDEKKGTTEKPKDATEETTPEGGTTEAPKKLPKKATNGGKIYKSAARPGKTVSPLDEEDT